MNCFNKKAKGTALHPIMFLLNPYPYCFLTVTNFTFTSHYVPIKSNLEKNLVNIFSPLHPIMFLLNQRLINSMMQEKFSLHPIMFLLNPNLSHFLNFRIVTLHPIMFLLNPIILNSIGYSFTSLHPIMFLLNIKGIYKTFVFTQIYIPLCSY